MKIRWKMLAAVLISLIIFLGVMQLTITSILSKSYQDLEDEMGELQVSQTLNAFQMEQDGLGLLIRDYTNWDDTYQYVLDGNPGYIEANMVVETFINLRLSDIAIVDDDGVALYATHLDAGNGTLVPSDRSLIDLITAGGYIDEVLTSEDEVSGLLDLNGTLTIFSCRKVFHSDTSGPAMGHLWFSRALDNISVDNVERLTSYQVTIERFDEEALNGTLGIVDVQKLLSDDMVFITEDEKTIILYGIVRDIMGDPAMVVITPMNREASHQGAATLQLMLNSVVILVVILLIIITMMLEGVVIRRVVHLDHDVDQIGRGSGPDKRIEFRGNDEIASLAGSINDMLNNLEEAQDKIRRSEARHKSILRDQTEMIFRFDGNFTITFANESFSKYYRFNSDDGPGIRILDKVGKDEVTKVVQATRSMNQQDSTCCLELRVIHGEDELRWQQWTMRPIFDEDGNLSEFQVVARDVTDQKRSEEELKQYRNGLEELVKERTSELMNVNRVLEKEVEKRRVVEKALTESQKQYQAVVEDQTELIVRMSPSGSINFMNGAFSKYFRLADRSIRQMFMPNILDEDLPQYAKFLSELSEDSPMGMIEYRVLLDGEVRWQQWTYRAIFGTDGTITEYQGVGRDITDKKKMEAEMARSASLESLGMLAGGMAHEFNNVLTVVLGNISLVKSSIAGNDPLFSRLENAELSIRDAKRLTDSILTFSDGGEPIKEVLLTLDLLGECAELLGAGAKISIQNLAGTGLWNIEGDRTQIVQALNAVMGNAIDSMPNGGAVRVQASNIVLDVPDRERGLHPGNYVRIDIIDQGTGISKEDMPHIFDPYFSTKGSNGLGLTTALSIVKRHHGNITVDSAKDVGSRFTLYLPATQMKADKDEVDRTAMKGRERVLLMDDEEGILEVTGELLREHGFEVELARTGEEAIDAYRDSLNEGRRFDLVIMDLTIKGGMGGKDAIIKLLELDPAVKAIVSSGYSNDPVMAHHEEHGFLGVVRKPYLISEMTKEIRRVLGPTDGDG